MKIDGIEHIGIAVNSIAESLPFYENVLGLKCYKTEDVPDQKVKTAFINAGNVKLELLEPTSVDSPIAKFIEKKGPGIHHIAYAVGDGVNVALKECARNNVRQIDDSARQGADNMVIAFLHPYSTFGVLTEFCEKL